MERVRGGKTQHVAVPAAATHALAPVLLSKDERQQLRVVKHRAFQRHQQNAMWTRSVFEFDGVTHRLSSGGDSESAEFVRDADYDAPHGEREGGEREGAGVMTQTRHTEEESRLREQIDAKAREIESTKLLIAQFEHDQQRNQERYVASLCLCVCVCVWQCNSIALLLPKGNGCN